MSAQNTSIQIGTNPSGPVFLVDGTAYTTTQVFEWPSGSAHVVQFLLAQGASGTTLGYQNSTPGGTEYQFNGWVDNSGLLVGTSPNITITASPSLTSLIATVSALYQVNIPFYNNTSSPLSSCTGTPGTPPASGLVYGIIYLDGGCIAGSTTVYLAAGPHTLNAFPYPGWLFYAWDINGNSITSAVTSINITSATTIIPEFSLAKIVQFVTNPPSLNVLIDGEPIQTPAAAPAPYGGSCQPGFALPPGAPAGFPPLCIGQADFLPGSNHHIGAATPQNDANGNPWVFSTFSNGLGQNAVYTAGTNTGVVDSVTANFIPGVRVTIGTVPNGLSLVVDGRTNWPSYNFIWGQGETHTVAAPAQNTDSTGRVWTFSAWSNAGPASQTITVPATSGMSLIANYTELQQVTVNSNPQGLTFAIDGSNCTTPCVLNKASGSQSQITIPASVTATASSRYDFVAWSDGSTATSRTVSFSQNALNLTAGYQTSYLLAASSNPANTAAFQYSPPTPDGFYASGTQVSVTATANTGYKFAHWDGDLSGTYATGTLTMSTPHNVIADTVSTPSASSAGIETAAGPTPDGSVAAGSLIAIYGQNFAPAFQLGPSNPLAQSIGNVTVTVNNQVLPLLYVSPGQLAAQVPWEIQPGTYTLAVHTTGQPDVDGSMIVARDAPAVFTQPNPQNLPLILALHQDGTVVTLASPARPNEQISIYCTGFGPFSTAIPDGFPPSDTQTYTVVDSISITAGPVQVQPDSANAATGMVGMTVVKMTITSAFPSATTVNLTMTVNGKVSSPVTLPLQ